AVGPIMKKQGQGRIVNIGSIAGFQPAGSSIAYSVSKAALTHLTRCMAVALAPEVLVNCVAPGFMEGTRMSSNLSPPYVEKAKKAALIGKAAEKEDVIEQILTFLRTESTTGQTVIIDGGRSIRRSCESRNPVFQYFQDSPRPSFFFWSPFPWPAKIREFNKAVFFPIGGLRWRHPRKKLLSYDGC
ncbi:MAG: fabG 4, partial [Deltaproteobacteria bacterium]|nr:fabG 4 [Deltaproteobacteria bacterium]